MGGSSSKSSSSSNRTTNTTTKTNNLALDGVEGVLLSGIEGDDIALNVTDGGAFEVVNRTIQAGEELFATALSTISESNSNNLQALTNSTVKSLEKINQSNESEQEALAGKFQTVAIAGILVYGAVTYWKSR
jgi:hypothetical protein